MERKEAIEVIKKNYPHCAESGTQFETALRTLIPELAESKDERIRKALITFFQRFSYERIDAAGTNVKEAIAWLEKQGNEPNWCHHQIGVTKVDLSGCSEEYRKAYYDGWNNCNQQHSQCKSEWNDVVKCLINGMKFYYEDNEEATWGTEKFSMKVKDILSWLEKQGESYTKRDVDDAYVEGMAFAKNELEKQGEQLSAIRWYDVSLIPQEMKELLVEWDSEDATWHEIAFYHADNKTFWNGTRQVENVTRWCYIIDLLEKQGGQKPKRMISAEAKEAMYDKPACAWSEEDKEMCQETIDWFEKKCFPYALENDNPARESIKWLKSIKQKIKGE